MHYIQPTALQIELSVVHTTVRSRNVTGASVFMPVEVPRRGGVNNSVAVCVQAVFGKLDPRRLVEWFEMQRLLGVSIVGVYSTPLTHPDTLKVLDHYANTSLAELRTISYIDGRNGRGHLLMVNLAAINDCLYRHLYTHSFIAVIDFDEVLFILFCYAALHIGATLSVAPRPSVRPSVRQSRASDFLEIGKP